MQQFHYTITSCVYEACLVMPYLQCMSCSERTPRLHTRSDGVEEREQYEDTVSIRYEVLKNQRRTWNLGSECWQALCSCAWIRGESDSLALDLKCDVRMYFKQLWVTHLTPRMYDFCTVYTLHATISLHCEVMSVLSLFGDALYPIFGDVLFPVHACVAVYVPHIMYVSTYVCTLNNCGKHTSHHLCTVYTLHATVSLHCKVMSIWSLFDAVLSLMHACVAV